MIVLIFIELILTRAYLIPKGISLHNSNKLAIKIRSVYFSLFGLALLAFKGWQIACLGLAYGLFLHWAIWDGLNNVWVGRKWFYYPDNSYNSETDKLGAQYHCAFNISKIISTILAISLWVLIWKHW